MRDSAEGWSRGKEISQSTVDDANELIRQGKGVDVLWGYATLAMQKKTWREACQYWEDILLQTPDDAAARFNLAQCQLFLADSDTVTPPERQELFAKAEAYYEDMLHHRDALSTKNKIAILMSYARLKRLQASYATDLQERNRLRKEVEPHLQEARRLAPWDRNILTLLSYLRQDQARDAAPEERTRACLTRRKVSSKNSPRGMLQPYSTTGPVSPLCAASQKRHWASWSKAARPERFRPANTLRKTKTWTTCASGRISKNFCNGPGLKNNR